MTLLELRWQGYMLLAIALYGPVIALWARDSEWTLRLAR